ncbi:hypothetical protein [Streptomyces sp. LN245]
MEIDESLAVKVETENGQTHTRIPAPALRALSRRRSGRCPRRRPGS